MTVRLLLICGSVRSGSVNDAVLRTAVEVAPADVEAVRYDGLADLPHFNPDEDRDPLHPAVADLRARIADAGALLFCTPEYAGAMPGALKNLLEWTVGGVETSGKPVGWINASTMPTGARNAYESLAAVLAYTDTTAVDGATEHIPVRRDQIDADGVVADSDLRARIGEVVRTLAAARSKA